MIDTNLWISFMIGKRLSSLGNVLSRQNVQIYICEQQLDEIKSVLARPKFNKLISAETRYYFFEMIYDICYMAEISVDAKSPIRDPKDLFLLSMAESVPVDYIVSGDKDLLALGNHAGIPIVSYNELQELLK